MSTTSMAIFSNPLFATYSVYARNASILIHTWPGPVGSWVLVDPVNVIHYLVWSTCTIYRVVLYRDILGSQTISGTLFELECPDRQTDI